MNLTETSLENPAGALVAILMVALLGALALFKLPVQLFPNVEEPVISILTTWRAAAGRDRMPPGELVRVESTAGAGGLRRVDGHRTIGLNVSPPRELSLGQAVELLKREVEPAVRAQLHADSSDHYEGNAGSLREAPTNTGENLALADHSMRVGTPVRVEIATTDRRSVVTVPRGVVIARQGASYVMRAGLDNTAERVSVNLAPGIANHVQVDGTVRAGDRVLIRGAERLEPGQTVKIQLL